MSAVGRFSHVVVDCTDPERLAGFWSAVLGVAVETRWKQYVMLAATADGAPAVAFQQVTETKSGKNRVHLDLAVADLDVAQATVESLGGIQVGATDEDGIALRIMADPEGNEFCLIRSPS